MAQATGSDGEVRIVVRPTPEGVEPTCTAPDDSPWGRPDEPKLRTIPDNPDNRDIPASRTSDQPG